MMDNETNNGHPDVPPTTSQIPASQISGHNLSLVTMESGDTSIEQAL